MHLRHILQQVVKLGWAQCCFSIAKIKWDQMNWSMSDHFLAVSLCTKQPRWQRAWNATHCSPLERERSRFQCWVGCEKRRTRLSNDQNLSWGFEYAGKVQLEVAVTPPHLPVPQRWELTWRWLEGIVENINLDLDRFQWNKWNTSIPGIRLLTQTAFFKMWCDVFFCFLCFF